MAAYGIPSGKAGKIGDFKWMLWCFLTFPKFSLGFLNISFWHPIDGMSLHHNIDHNTNHYQHSWYLQPLKPPYYSHHNHYSNLSISMSIIILQYNHKNHYSCLFKTITVKFRIDIISLYVYIQNSVIYIYISLLYKLCITISLYHNFTIIHI